MLLWWKMGYPRSHNRSIPGNNCCLLRSWKFCMVIENLVWSCIILYCHGKSCMVVRGIVWSPMVLYNLLLSNVVYYDFHSHPLYCIAVWSCIILHWLLGLLWSCLILESPVWDSMVLYCLILSFMVLYILMV